MPPPHPEGCQTSSLPLPPILGVPPPSSRAARPRCPLSPLPPSGYPSPRPPGCVCVCACSPPPPPAPDLRGAVQLVQAQLPGLAGALRVGGGGHGGRGVLRGGDGTGYRRLPRYGTLPSLRVPAAPSPSATGGFPRPPPPKKNLLPAARRGSGAWRARHFLMARGDDVTRDTRPASPLPT